MKKFLIPMMIVAIIIALYQQGKTDKNVFVQVISIVAFMYGMMRLSAKTPSKNINKDEENVN
jgi:hypothetical protein